MKECLGSLRSVREEGGVKSAQISKY